MTTDKILFLLYIGIQIAAALCAVRAVSRARTPQGAVGWVVFLFAAPHFAVPAFLVFGHRRYPGYVAARRALHSEIATLREQGMEHAPRRSAMEGTDEGRITAFEGLAGIPATGGNRVDLLIDGETAFGAVFEAIDSARDYVLVQYYTISDDLLGRSLADRLIARAQAGVRVYVLYDKLGSRKITHGYIERLRDAGVDIRDFHAIRPSRTRLQINFRNHRKIVVVDGDISFTGGMNLADDYMGRNPRFGPWRDTMVRIDGPVVAQLQFVFAEDWLWSSGDKLDLNWEPRETHGASGALVLSPSPADRRETGALYFVNAIEAARERVWIASAYFVPDTDILTALKLAALRGVEVRILVPDRSDHWLVWLAAYAHFDEMREAGVEIWRYTEGFMHQKVVLVDDCIASIGSVNLDNRSCRLNFEVTLLVFDRDFAQRVEAMLNADLARCHKLTVSLENQSSFWLRTGAPLARLFAPIL